MWLHARYVEDVLHDFLKPLGILAHDLRQLFEFRIVCILFQ